MNRCGVIYQGHVDVWLINQLQVSLEATRHLIPDSQTLTGWINGDLYSPAGETIGIIPVPDPICASADIESYYHEQDSKNKHAYLARQQKTKYAVISIHTNAERALFKKLMQEDPLLTGQKQCQTGSNVSKCGTEMQMAKIFFIRSVKVTFIFGYNY